MPPIKGCNDRSLEDFLLEIAGSKHSHLEHCDEKHDDDCPCGGGGGDSAPAKVDLIVLIDTSGSMQMKAEAVNNAAAAVVDRALQLCNVDLEHHWLGIEGTYSFAGSRFTQTCRDFLNAAGCTSQTADPTPSGDHGQKEEGANSIADLCNCDVIWRRGACKAIFYISDEPLDRGAPQDSGDMNATSIAIAAAQANNVKIFAHLAQGNYHNNAATRQDYMDLCQQTGGQEFLGNPATEEEYQRLLELAICQACGGCKKLDLPAVSPCFSVVWGDSECDCLETDDYEVLIIKACNCYANVAFQNLVIGRLTVTDSDGKPVPALPDGTPSVEIVPSGPICFGTLAPCTDNEPSCKAREIVIRTRGAVAGSYQLKFGPVCFDVVNHFSTETCFSFKLCKD